MAIIATTSVLTGEDWKMAKDIKPGDWVFNRLGQPVKVKTAQMYRSEECYRVIFDDYMTISGDRHLAFPSEDNIHRTTTHRYKGVKRFRRQLKRRDVLQMLEEGLLFRGNRMQFSVPTTEPIQLPDQPLSIPPFLYGFWFIARKPEEILEVPYEFAEKVYGKFKESGYKIKELGTVRNRYYKFRTEPSIWSQVKGKQTYKMPLSYLFSGKDQRFELLQGLLCAKPCRTTSKLGMFKLKLRNKATITLIQYLSESLGAKTTLFHDKSMRRDWLTIKREPTFLPDLVPTRPYVHHARRYVKSIETIPAQLCVHIETDDSDGSYLAGEGFISCL